MKILGNYILVNTKCHSDDRREEDELLSEAKKLKSASKCIQWVYSDSSLTLRMTRGEWHKEGKLRMTKRGKL